MQGLESRAARRLLIAFVDITGYTQFAERTADHELAELMDRYYERIGELVGRAGGTFVKPIGDGALIVFPPERADEAVDALLELRDDVCALCSAAGWPGTLVVRVHAGEVVCGPFGARAEKRFDIMGREVNLTARLPTRGFALSAEAFRCLSPEGRARFKKHTLPITYIPVADRRPSASAKL
jgi:class 3 adenylate cyclase